MSAEKRYLCGKCGKAFATKKERDKHDPDCTDSVLQRLERMDSQLKEMDNKINLTVLSEAELGKHLSILESCIDQIVGFLNNGLPDGKKLKSERAVDVAKKEVPEGTEIRLLTRGLDVYKVDEKGNQIKINVSELVEKIIKKELHKL